MHQTKKHTIKGFFMKKSIKNLLYKSHLYVIVLSFFASLLIITAFLLRFSYSNTQKIISDIRVSWENADRNIQLSVTRWLKGKPFRTTKESMKLTTDKLSILKKRTNSILYPKEFRKDIQLASQSWKLLNDEKLHSIIEKLDAFTKSNSFLKMETEDKLKYFQNASNNYLQNLNLRELIYNYKTRNHGKWDKLTQQGVELLDQINTMYTYTDNFSKKLESIADKMDSLLHIITILCFTSVTILVILQVMAGLFLTQKISNSISSPLMQSSQKLINFVGKSLESKNSADDESFLNEVEQLQYSVDTLINYYNQIAKIAEKLAIGDTTENITLTTNRPDLPTDQNNLIYKAADLLKKEFHITKGIRIHLEKNIPVAAGMAGGSTDCATTLVGINSLFSLGLTLEELRTRGVTLGADVPYCLMGGTALSEGIGEILTPLPDIPSCPVLLVKPNIDISTKWVYTTLKWQDLTTHPDIPKMIQALEAKDLHTIANTMENVLETVTIPANPIIQTIKDTMLSLGAINSMMSGSGPTVFGLFESKEAAGIAYHQCKQNYPNFQIELTEFVGQKQVQNQI